jgi:hypothetical protein
MNNERRDARRDVHGSDPVALKGPYQFLPCLNGGQGAAAKGRDPNAVRRSPTDYRDCCPHGVPLRWPEECIECEIQELIDIEGDDEKAT